MFGARGTSHDDETFELGFAEFFAEVVVRSFDASDSKHAFCNRVQQNQQLTLTQVVVSSVKANPQPEDSAAALLHRAAADSLAPRTLVDSARTTRPHRTILSAVAPQVQTIRSVEEAQLLALALATPPTPDQASHSEEETQLLLATRHKAPLPLPSRRLLRKMALALVRPVLIKVSLCSLSTRTRVSRS